ncbi:MAG: 4'-phosphopantetheinyl transferase superfamily protein [Gemmatimonadota bacterium]
MSLAPASTGRLLVGNDVVLVRDARCVGKSRDLRFAKRVLAPEELSNVLASEDPDESLWLHWAAKEAAFKVVTKIEGHPPVFAHARFVVDVQRGPSRHTEWSFEASGTVTFAGVRLPFRASVTRDRIHALSWSGEDPQREAPEIEIRTGEASVGRSRGRVDAGIQPFALLLNERFSFHERRSIHSPPSAYVRLFARASIAEALDVDERRLEIVSGTEATGRVPPRVLLDGLPAPVDLSLSHHGALVAWAFAVEDPRA